MSSQMRLPDSSSQSRDVDGSLYLLIAAIAGLVLFLVFLLGSATTNQSPSRNSIKARAMQGVEISDQPSDISFQGQ